MKVVVFAGGVGTRLWPLSRRKSPKQFEKIVGDKSTLQLAVELLYPEISPSDIYIATSLEYIDLVSQQLSEIPKENIIGEPLRRDLGPAVAFWMGYLSKKFPVEPTLVLWSDHLIQDKKKLKHIIKGGTELLRQDSEKIIYLGHTPRFASENLGWIQTGEVVKIVEKTKFKSFQAFKYRPDKELAQEYFVDGKHCWNLGTFMTTPLFMYKLYERFAPKIYKLTEDILANLDKPNFQEEFARIYGEMPKISVDNAISEQIDSQFALVAVDDIGWSDVGAWEALKEALQQNKEDNVTKGKVLVEDSRDSLVYNYDSEKLVVGIDLDDMLIVNTHDVLLVTKKTSVPKIKKLVESFEGTLYDELT